MTTITISNGCISLGEGLYRYDYTKANGLYSIVFSAPRTPRIGDTVDDETNTWAPAELPQSNQDKSRWIKLPYEEWPDFE